MGNFRESSRALWSYLIVFTCTEFNSHIRLYLSTSYILISTPHYPTGSMPHYSWSRVSGFHSNLSDKKEHPNQPGFAAISFCLLVILSFFKKQLQSCKRKCLFEMALVVRVFFFSADLLYLMGSFLFFSGKPYHFWLMLSVLTTKGNLEKNCNLWFYTRFTNMVPSAFPWITQTWSRKGIRFPFAFNQPSINVFSKLNVMWTLEVQRVSKEE